MPFYTHEYLGSFQNWLLFFRCPSKETILIPALWSWLWLGWWAGILVALALLWNWFRMPVTLTLDKPPVDP